MMRALALMVSLTLLAPAQAFRDRFDVRTSELVSTGRSKYFVLEPGYQLLLGDRNVRLLITVLDETRVVDGVTTRVVEERESEGQKLIEVSRNFFALHPATGDVYYFGEEVDMYTDGRVTSHDGAWLSGVNGARFGLMLPGAPAVGQRYYQEVARKIAMDRAEVVAIDAAVQTPAGPFKGCVRVRESTPLEPGVTEYKIHAPGVGLVQDSDLKLIRHGTKIERE